MNIKRFSEISGGPGLHGGDGGFDAAVTGENDDFGVGQFAAGVREDLQAAYAVHHQVGDDNVETLALHQFKAFHTATGDGAIVANAAKAFGHGVGMGFIVIHHQDSYRFIHWSLIPVRFGQNLRENPPTAGS